MASGFSCSTLLKPTKPSAGEKTIFKIGAPGAFGSPVQRPAAQVALYLFHPVEWNHPLLATMPTTYPQQSPLSRWLPGLKLWPKELKETLTEAKSRAPRSIQQLHAHFLTTFHFPFSDELVSNEKLDRV